MTGRLVAVPLLVAGTLFWCRSTPPPSSPSPPLTASAAPAASTAAPPVPIQLTSEMLQPELVAFPSGPLTLHGFLYRPPGPGPFPAMVFNHGSEDLPGPKPDQARFYVPHGFVLFIPHRRGQGRSRDVGSPIRQPEDAGPSYFADLLATQTDDVTAAVRYVASLPYVDPKRVAISGCSFGGVVSLFAAARPIGVVAAVDFAGGAMRWAVDPTLQDRMKAAARAATVPVFFVQAENDFTTAPSLVLSDEMKRAGKPARVHVFPPKGTTAMDGHGFCMGGEDPPWGDEVLGFLRETMRR